MISTREKFRFVHLCSLAIVRAELSSSEARGTWRRKYWILPMKNLFHTRRVLKNAINPQHETDSFASLLKKVVLRILSPSKSHCPRQGLNPRTLYPMTSTLPLDQRGYRLRHTDVSGSMLSGTPVYSVYSTYIHTHIHLTPVIVNSATHVTAVGFWKYGEIGSNANKPHSNVIALSRFTEPITATTEQLDQRRR
jgi:hypothetical protein